MAADEWSRRPVPVVARLIEISAAFGSWWVKSKLHNTPQLAAADMRNVSPADILHVRMSAHAGCLALS
jgi:hypothetical protein